jgi:hypothetical protein
MNVVNRLLGLLFLLLVLAAALATIGLVTDLLTVPDVRQVWAYGPVVTITHDLGHLGAGRWPWVLGGAIVAGLIALILLVRELTPPSRRARVEPQRRALMVRCRALVSPYADLAVVGPELQRTIADRLRHVTGLPVQTVRVRTTVQEGRPRRQVR